MVAIYIYIYMVQRLWNGTDSNIKSKNVGMVGLPEKNEVLMEVRV